MIYRLAQEMLEATFEHFRRCGCGRAECQTVWISAWDNPEIISKVVHPEHAAHRGGFVIDDAWLNAFWIELGDTNCGTTPEGMLL